AEGRVFDELDGLRSDRLVEARPAASGIELRAAAEQLRPTRTTGVEACALFVEKCAGPGALGRGLAQDGVAGLVQLGAPFAIGLVHAVRHGSSCVASILNPFRRGRGKRMPRERACGDARPARRSLD